MNNTSEIRISPSFNSAPDAATVSNATSGAANINKSIFGEYLFYYAINEISSGAVAQLRRSFLVSDEDALAAIADQQVEELIEIFPQLSKEVRHRIVSKLQSFLQEDLQDESGSVQESTVPGLDSGITRAEQAERIMESILSKPQKKTDFFRMVGAFNELTSLDDE